jgi:hypothetical protein
MFRFGHEHSPNEIQPPRVRRSTVVNIGLFLSLAAATRRRSGNLSSSPTVRILFTANATCDGELSVDKPLVTQAVNDRMLATEKAVQTAASDAATAMFKGMRGPRAFTIHSDDAQPVQQTLAETRRALAAARWRLRPRLGRRGLSVSGL